MTITVRRMALIVGALFLCLLIQANRIQVVKADALNDRAGNTRAIIDDYGQQRGSIIVGGQQVARSVDTGNTRLRYERRYGSGPKYAPATGFYSIVYGATGIERQENALLSGDDPRLIGTQLEALISGGSRQGASVRLTLDAAAQKAAWDGIKQYNGAVVAIEPATGRILALASSPSYDPNPLSSNDPAQNRAAWERLTADPKEPLLNRPLAATYPPGSVFKVVTTAAALSSGQYTTETEIPAPAVLDLPGTTADLPNYNKQACFGGQVTLEQALQISCNTAFANVGLTLGDDILREQAELFGFNRSFDVPMTSATSVFPSDLNAPQTAQAAIGQFDVRATALQIAMVGAALANGGLVMNPYLVDEVLAPDLSVLSLSQPSEFGRAVSPEIAQEITDMLVNVVENGTGRPAQIPGVLVAGKTGTAQTAEGRAPHAWFLSYSPADNPTVAVAVVVENGGNLGSEATGGRLAAPIAKAVMEAILR